MGLTILAHPLGSHLLTQLRDKTTEPAQFRSVTRRLTLLLAAEATKSLNTNTVHKETPLEPFDGAELTPVVAVPILRAGLGMLESFVELVPDVAVGYIGLERDESTAVASSYYAKLPPNIAGKPTFVLDPMLATGGSASQAVSLVKNAGAGPITMVAIVAAPEGVDRLLTVHPDVAIVTAALDRGLNDRKYILPGLGDFGDRLYGTEP
ncbi:MAG: uracil phosphoribosyltransferase [Capsulimonadaceae bacterium]|nr:uracil phosphoribosyltransferase [Capsulimonadaceae bacterium]